jgi:hypothetical protein
MAGKLIIDTIQTESSFLQMNVSNTRVATINASGIYSNTGTKMIGYDGTVSATLSANTLANSSFQTGSIENYMRANSLDFGLRNRIINGAMMIDQRNSGNTISGSGYSVDRWIVGVDTDGTYTVKQDSSANTVAGFTNSLKFTTTSADASLSAAQYATVGQYIEGVNIYDLAWGTASAKAITLSFWVRSSLTGSFGGSIANNAVDRSYPFSYTIVAANTWEQKFITIPGDQSGTWLTTNSVGLRLWFTLGNGSTYSGTANTWAGAQYFGPTGSTSVIGTLNATWYLTGVQLEEGSQATPFEFRPYSKELMMCQRYYQRSYDLGVATGTVVAGPVSGSWQYNQPSFFIGTGNYGMNCGTPFPVLMRTIPTITVYSPSSGTAGSITPWNGSDYTLISSGGFVNASTSRITGGGYNNATTSGLIYGFQWTASAEL